jgi:hypothetical protein
VAVEIEIVNVLVVPNREGGNREWVSLRRTRFSRQIFIGPVCAVIEKLMHIAEFPPTCEVVDVLLIVGRCKN